MNAKSENVVWQTTRVEHLHRQKLLGQKAVALWFTGLSGSGKSTIAVELESRLMAAGRASYLLDGDNLRHGINADLDFSEAARKENIRRLAYLSALIVDSGLFCLVSAISPFRGDRDQARTLMPKRFVEVFVNTPLEICEQRDPKGLYQKARRGEIANFTGISSPYEAPLNPEIIIDTESYTVKQSVDFVFDWLEKQGLLHI